MSGLTTRIVGALLILLVGYLWIGFVLAVRAALRSHQHKHLGSIGVPPWAVATPAIFAILQMTLVWPKDILEHRKHDKL